MADDFILTEDGFHIILEDGSGDLLLEDEIIPAPVGGGSGRLGVAALNDRAGQGQINARAGTGLITGRTGRASF